MRCRTEKMSAELLAKQRLDLPIKFTKSQQERIKKKYESRCALCCLGIEDGVDICVTHKRASIVGGNSTLENGIVLCTEHNQTRYNADINHTKIYTSLMLKVAKNKKDKRMENFYSEVLNLHKKHHVL